MLGDEKGWLKRGEYGRDEVWDEAPYILLNSSADSVSLLNWASNVGEAERERVPFLTRFANWPTSCTIESRNGQNNTVGDSGNAPYLEKYMRILAHLCV